MREDLLSDARVSMTRTNQKSSSNVARRRLVLLTAIAVALRLVAAEVFVGGLNGETQGDEGGYINLATGLVHGHGFADRDGTPKSYPLPGLPLLLTIPIALVGPNV